MCSFIGTGFLVGVDIIVELPAIPDHHHVQHLLAGGILQPWIIYVIHDVFHMMEMFGEDSFISDGINSNLPVTGEL